jgi:formylglycine-generating enzyme required for sulfatase activity
MSIRYAVAAALALGLSCVAEAHAEQSAPQDAQKQCADEWRAAKAAQTLAGRHWQEFWRECRARFLEQREAAGEDKSAQQPGDDAGKVPEKSRTPLSRAEENALRPKDEFKECENCPEMVLVPAGSFIMGSERQGGSGRHDDEAPKHRVTIPRPFAVGKFAVTFDEWDACVADGGCNGYRPNDEGFGRGRLPAINISWVDAKAYAAWLSNKTGKPYRLLSDAEWEYAARGGTTTPYWWGASISKELANYAATKTVPVDSYKPNPFGLYNVHGNVYQWVEDCFHHSGFSSTTMDWIKGVPAKDLPLDGSPWLNGCEKDSPRVIRGGGWFGDNIDKLRSAYRGVWESDERHGRPYHFLGLRVARSLTVDK